MLKEKKYIILLFATISLLGISSIIIFNTIRWKEPLASAETFIETWGTYDYNNFEEYPKRIKPLSTNDFYDANFNGEENLMSLAIRGGRLISSRGSAETILIDIKRKKLTPKGFSITALVEEKIEEQNITEKTNKLVTLELIKEGNKYLVYNLNYEE